MHTRGFPMRQLVAATTVALGIWCTALTPSQAATAGDPMAFGAFPGVATRSSTLAFEANAGRSLAFVRVYDRWDDIFPNTQTSWMKSTGHSLFLSIRARRLDGTNVSWRAIANAGP